MPKIDPNTKYIATLGKRKHIDADTLQEPVPTHTEFINLTTHAGHYGANPIPVKWGETDPMQRGPLIATARHQEMRNCIGAHAGSYSIYRGLAVACGALDPMYVPHFEATTPVAKIGPHPQWSAKHPTLPGGHLIASFDPFGHIVTEAFPEYFERGYDIRPTIAVAKAHIDLPELRDALASGKLRADGETMTRSGSVIVTKAAIEPAWHLPSVAARFGCNEYKLRQCLFNETNGMYPELLTRTDLEVFLPPIGGLTIYMFGDVSTIHDPEVNLTVRVHDECNGSDVFGSDICTCRPYLIHGIIECVAEAQAGGAGVIVYYRKEGRALGEVTKYLVYNMRKRQEGGDRAEEYFNCTQHVAGVQDVRFQVLMPDALHWLGVTRIHKFISMSDMKYNAIASTGIEIVNRVPIPEEMVPADAQVEITAKVFAGYNGGAVYSVDAEKLKSVVGRPDDLKEE